MNYDVVIIGGGPSGLTAGIYASRAGLSVAIVEMRFAGGQITSAENVENYPSFNQISGVDLAMKMLEQAESCGAVMIYDKVAATDFSNDDKVITLASGSKLNCRAVILAMGAEARKIGLDNEDKFIGRGVSYCALCDGALYKGKRVIVVGGGNTAIGDAVYINKFASKVYLVHRREEFRATKVELDRLHNSTIEVITDSVISVIHGDKMVEGVSIKNVKNDEIKKIDLDGIFVAIGQVPQSQDIGKDVLRDKSGYVVGSEDCTTNISGVFVAGDVRTKHVRQVVTATSDGAVAAEMAVLHLS